jgi:hypothetical protein
MCSNSRHPVRNAIFAMGIFAISAPLTIAPASAAHHVKKHWRHTQTHYQYRPEVDRARFPWTIDDFNVNGD